MRATQAPEQWRKLLDATNAGDYKLARKLCITYEFGKCEQETPETPAGTRELVFAKSPTGYLIRATSAAELSRMLGKGDRFVEMCLAKGVALTGGFAGWQFWKDRGYYNGTRQDLDWSQIRIVAYYAESPDGEVYQDESSTKLSEHLGLGRTRIHSFLKGASETTVKQGIMKGWKFWKVAK